MNLKLTSAIAALVGAVMFVPAALAHGTSGPFGGQGYGNFPSPGQGAGMMGRGYGGGMMGPGHGAGMMGRGQGGGMMGQGFGGGMMGPGHGAGMMGQAPGGGAMGLGYGGGVPPCRDGVAGAAAPLAQDLTMDGARHMMEYRVQRLGNPNLMLGDVVEKDQDTISADMVTKDGSLVRRFMIDRHTGMMRPADQEK